jgi:hypothetical protein
MTTAQVSPGSTTRKPDRTVPAGDLPPCIKPEMLASIADSTGIDSDLPLASDPAWLPQPGPASHPLLPLLTHCYAAGLYGSEDIAEAVRWNPQLRSICANQLPEARDLRRFRRTHRERITHCLAQILAQSTTTTTPAHRGHNRSSYLAVSLGRWASRGLPIVSPLDAVCAVEAERRVHRAIQKDSADLDD